MFLSRFQIHLTRKENSICGWARFHNGDLPGWPRHCVRRNPVERHACQHVSHASMFMIHCTMNGVQDCDRSCVSFFRPQSLLNGMNKFLESLKITFRRDPNNFRPRINKMNSVKVSSRHYEIKLSWNGIIIHFARSISGHGAKIDRPILFHGGLESGPSTTRLDVFEWNSLTLVNWET